MGWMLPTNGAIIFRRCVLLRSEKYSFFNSSAWISATITNREMKSYSQTRQEHAHILKTALVRETYHATRIMTSYFRQGRLEYARQVFDEMSEPDVVAWSSLITGYSSNGFHEKALLLFSVMRSTACAPNHYTFTAILQACVSINALELGKQVHSCALKLGFGLQISVATSLVFVYGKCGDLEYARQLFDRMSEKNDVSWTSMISAYATHGAGETALTLISQSQEEGIPASAYMHSVALRACVEMKDGSQGKCIHAQIVKSGFELDNVVANALIDMYAKCGLVQDSWLVFCRLLEKDVISWNTIIGGFANAGCGEKALDVFKVMMKNGMRPDQCTYTSVISACAEVAAFEQGRQVHAQMIRNGSISGSLLMDALVDMYSKCGCIEYSRIVFDRLGERTLVTWSAMITGYAKHGMGQEAIDLFENMLRQGTKPDHVVFLVVLAACSHAGLMEKGWQYFKSMESDYSLRPRTGHYACMVDLLGRAGKLDEAYEFIMGMPIEQDFSVWGALLGACRVLCNLELGKLAAQRVLELNPDDSGAYIILSNIFASAHQLDSAAAVRSLMRKRRVKKDPGWSRIEVNNQMHQFLVGDKFHPRIGEIYEYLGKLDTAIREAGYVPDTSFALHAVEHEQKESDLRVHCEKIAIAFGLMSTPAGKEIRIINNQRVCGDCHSAFKFISKVSGRRIILRDGCRFHTIKGGFCSCNDYW